MAGKRDWHAKGQQDREKARDDGWVDLVIGGGGSPHYNPPDDPDDKEAYDAGWENAEYNPPDDDA